VILFENLLNKLLQDKKINVRQHTIVTTLMATGWEIKLSELQTKPWYQALYKKLTNKTRSRDLKSLEAQQLISVSKEKLLKLLVP